MEKKNIILSIIFGLFIFLWLLFLGQINGVSAFKGDINLIDEGQYAAWVNHMLHGKIMYKDFFPPYGPLHIYALYFIVKFFGPSVFYIRIYLSVIGIFLGILAVLFALARLKVKPVLAAIVFLFILIYPGAYVRMWLGIFTLLFGQWAFEIRSQKKILITGLLLIATVLQSIEVGFFSVFLFVIYVLGRNILSKNKKKELKLLIPFFAGLLIGLIIFLLVAVKDGWLFYFIRETTIYLLSVSGNNLPNGQGLPDLNLFFKYYSPIELAKFIFSKQMLFYWSLLAFVLFEAILIMRFILRKFTRIDLSVLFIVSFSILSYFSIVGRSGHNLLYAHLVVICASYFLSLLPSFSRSKKDVRAISIILFSIFILYIARFLMIYRYSQFPLFKTNTVSNVERVKPLGISKSQADDIRKLQDYANKNSQKDDQIFVINNLPALYFLLDRVNSTRFDFPLLAISKKDRFNLIEQLSLNPPVFIIEDIKAWAVDDVSDKKRLPEVYDFVFRNYKFVKQINHYRIYKKINNV